MIKSTLKELILERRLGSFGIGQKISEFQRLGTVGHLWFSTCVENDELTGWYEFGDVEFHCARNGQGEMAIFAILYYPGKEQRDRRKREEDPAGAGYFSVDSSGIHVDQLIQDVLPKLSEFGARYDRHIGQEVTIYALGDHAKVVFNWDDKTDETYLVSFEVT